MIDKVAQLTRMYGSAMRTSELVLPGVCRVSLYTRSRPCSHLSVSPGVGALTTSKRSGKLICDATDRQ